MEGRTPSSALGVASNLVEQGLKTNSQPYEFPALLPGRMRPGSTFIYPTRARRRIASAVKATVITASTIKYTTTPPWLDGPDAPVAN
jgi:hypothetical protein